MTTWHVDDVALARWVEGIDGSISGASVEQHLLTCATCRAKVPAPAVLDPVWARVRDAVEVPPLSLLERVALRLGLPAPDARIIAVSPALRAAWLTGLTAMLAFVLFAGASGHGRAQWLFLAVAPLVPALAVALGYDPELDEAIEQEAATPYSRLRLVLLRSAALLLIALPLLLLVSLLVPGHIAFLWLVPAAGCTALVLAASTWVTPLTAVGSVAAAWVTLLGSVAWHGSATGVLDDSHLLSYAVTIALSLALLVARSGRLSQLTWGER